jgi:hypothetical protein
MARDRVYYLPSAFDPLSDSGSGFSPYRQVGHLNLSKQFGVLVASVVVPRGAVEPPTRSAAVLESDVPNRMGMGPWVQAFRMNSFLP